MYIYSWNLTALCSNVLNFFIKLSRILGPFPEMKGIKEVKIFLFVQITLYLEKYLNDQRPDFKDQKLFDDAGINVRKGKKMSVVICGCSLISKS